MLLINATIATLSGDEDYGIIENGAIHIVGDTIKWLGLTAKIPKSADTDEVYDCASKLVTPGLIDCHTHIVYAGNRATEFELRLKGTSYQQISESGGGIVSTVSATRDATLEELIAESTPRLARLMSEGVTTVEIKSGYGLDTDNELKMLKAAQKLGQAHDIQVKKTFLGAHALPIEFSGQPDAYIDFVCKDMLPAAYQAGLVDAVDAFCENIGFSVDQVNRVFDIAQDFGLPIKLHAEQLSDLGGAKMAAARGALSVDHLEYLNPKDVHLLADSGTVAVLLPGAFYFLKETKLPPIAAMRTNRVAIALASDCNPGSSPLTSLLLTMNMACTLFSLTPAEALRGVTINAAKALGLQNTIGTLEPGKIADLVIWNTQNPATLSYNIGLNPCQRVMVKGHWRNL